MIKFIKLQEKFQSLLVIHVQNVRLFTVIILVIFTRVTRLLVRPVLAVTDLSLISL